MKYLLFILIGAAGFISNAQAQEKWVLLDDGKRWDIYYDSLSVSMGTSLSGNANLKVKMVYTTPHYIKDIDKSAEYIIMNVQIDCASQTVSSPGSTLYFTDGTKKESNEKQEWKGINGGTPIKKVFDMFCR
jgi:hypothetical protein